MGTASKVLCKQLFMKEVNEARHTRRTVTNHRSVVLARAEILAHRVEGWMEVLVGRQECSLRVSLSTYHELAPLTEGMST